MKNKPKLKIYEYQEICKKYYDECWSFRSIATYLGRSPSTISRVFKRDKGVREGLWEEMTTYEKSMQLWHQSKVRMRQGRHRLKLKCERIRK